MKIAKTALITIAALSVWAAPAVASACSYAYEKYGFRTDPDADVSMGLEKPTLEVVSIHRDQPKWRPFAGRCSLGPASTMLLEVTPHVEGSNSGEEPVGYVFNVEEGEPPEGLSFPSEPVAFWGTEVMFSWPARKRRHQDGFDFTLTVTPIAKNGEPGPTSDPVRIRRGDAGGCSTTGEDGPAGAAWLVVLAGMLAIRSRSRL